MPRTPALLLLLCLFTVHALHAQQNKMRVYLLPGHGSDGRVFAKLKLDTALYDTVHVRYSIPVKHESMHLFARRMAVQVDTTRPFILVGQSMGGMLAVEMATFLHPQKTIIVSSADSRSELPIRYKFMKAVPLYRALPAGMLKAGAFVAQPLFEPDRNKEKATFKAMLKAKDKRFVKRAIDMIVRWKGPQQPVNGMLLQVHGTKDHTLPFRRIHADVVVRKGSHMMVLTRGEEISGIVSELLRK